MPKLLIGCALSIGALILTISPVSADGGGCVGLGYCCTYASSAAYPTANPPGWYTNTYSYAWYYPWYAYYNSSSGPYANWAAGRGYATYGYQKQGGATTIPAVVTITLPTEAKLYFSGKLAEGTGAIRVFPTPPLEPNQEYAYEMTVEVTKDGLTRKATRMVTVHAGENVQIKFDLTELKEAAPEKK